MHYRTLAPCLGGLALLLSLATTGAAQTVTGTITDAVTGEPISAAYVTLERVEDRASVARTLSRGDGRFRVGTDGSGTYRLRVQRLGFAEHVGEAVDLGPGETVDRRISLRTRAIEIEGVVARGERRCVLRPEEGEATQQLWEQARAVLAVADAMEEDEPRRFRTRTWDRVVGIDGETILWERARHGRGYGREAFVADSPELLAEQGFVRELPSGEYLYAGLTARVLLSEPFLDGHCFRVVGPTGESEAGLVGLSFEPVGRPRRPDVRGVLWMDAESYGLSHIDYTYTDHLLPFRVPLEPFGGRTGFRELPGGAWVVDRWTIRMPLVEDRRVSDELPAGTERVITLPARPTPAGRGEYEEIRLLVMEVGGEVVPEGEPDAGPPAVLTGVVTDRLGSPLPGATVFLSGTANAATTDADGRYEMEVFQEGDFTLAVAHPEFEGRRLDQRIVDVTLRRGETQRVTFRATERAQRAGVPVDAPAAAVVCAPEATGSGALTVTGRVLEAGADVPLQGAVVRLTVGPTEELVARSDALGEVRFCGVPWAERLRLRTRLADVAEMITTVSPPPGAGEVDAEIALAVNRPGALTGRVVRGDALRPLARAEVAVLGEAGRSATTNRDGRFFIDDLPPGPHRIVVRHVGFAADTVRVEVSGGAATEVELRADARVYELEPVVVQGTHSGFLRDFHWRRARAISGAFISRVDIERRGPTTVTHMIAETPGVRMEGGGTGRRNVIYFSQAEHFDCPAQVYLDGIHLNPGGASVVIDDYVTPSGVAGIEIYPRGTGAPGEFWGPQSRCGVVAIWTRRGPD